MKIIKPIVFFDLETTSIDTETARIVQIACVKISPNNEKETKEFLVNPTVPIPLDASEIHHITNDMVKNSPTFKQLSINLRNWFDGCDLGGYNSNSFDIPVLSAELVRAGLEPINWNPNLFDVLLLYRHLFPNTLSDVYKRLIGKDLDGAHNALIDVEATLEIAEYLTVDETVGAVDLILQGDKLRVDLAGKLYKDSQGVIRYNFGKDKDSSVAENTGFARWMLNQGFPQETKNIILEILKNK